jgi:hypothetical protein
MIEPRLWTRLWILWITCARLVMSSADDRPPDLVDRPSPPRTDKLSPGLGMESGRPLGVSIPVRRPR